MIRCRSIHRHLRTARQQHANATSIPTATQKSIHILSQHHRHHPPSFRHLSRHIYQSTPLSLSTSTVSATATEAALNQDQVMAQDARAISRTNKNKNENKIPENTGQNSGAHAAMCPGEGIDEYTARKRQLMQYLQNESWHDVDRIIDRIKDVNDHDHARVPGSNSGTDIDASAGDFLRLKVDREYKMRMRAGKKFVQEKNQLRLERRRNKQMVKTIAAVGDEDQVMFVPTSGTQALSSIEEQQGLEVEEEEISHDLQSSENNYDASTAHASPSLLCILNNNDDDDKDDDKDDDALICSPIQPIDEPTSVEKNRLLSLFGNERDGTKVNNVNSGMDAKVNLMDLLNDNESFEDASKSTSHTGNEQHGQQKKKISLLDLLDDDFFDSGESHTDDAHDQAGPNAGSSFQGITKPMDNTSLWDLLNDDVNDKGSSSKKKTSSLLDLLDDDFHESNLKVHDMNLLDKSQMSLQNQSSGEPASGSLLDLLDESREIGTDPLLDTLPHKSLLDLLDDDHDDFTANDHKTMLTNETKVSSNSLFTLLDGKKDGWSDKSDGPKGSLLDMLDDTDFNVRVEDENAEIDEEVEIEEVTEAYQLRDVMIRVQSLVSSMRRKDWDELRQGGAFKNSGADTQENSIPSGQEKLMSDLFDDMDVETDGVDADADDLYRCDEFVDELLMGSSANKWALRSDEFNLLILRVATSVKNDNIEKVLDIFLHMKELESSGRADAGPNPTTYAILLNLFESIPGASAIANDICNEIVERINLNVDSPNVFLNEDSLNAVMRIQTKRLDIEGAGTIMNYALSESSGGLRVSPNAFKLMILLHKSFNEQEKALTLIKACLEENQADWPGLHKFLMNATVWPRRNREGKQIAIASYCENVICILEDKTGKQFVPSLHVWKKLLTLSMHAAKAESDTNWLLVHKCCRALISHREMSEDNLDERLLSVGLDAAEKMKDPQLAADLICRTRAEPIFKHDLDELDYEENPTANRTPLRVSPSTYVRAIKLCIRNGMPSEGDRILAHCLKNDLPSKALGDMHTLVLTGYARTGDVGKAKHLFQQLRKTQILVTESTYAAYLHSLANSGNHEEVMSVLQSMLNGSNEDGIRPEIACFTSCMLSAMQTEAYNDVLALGEKMKEVGVRPNVTTFQGILLANGRLGDKMGISSAIDNALALDTPIDINSFLLSAKYLIPSVVGNRGTDIEAMRSYLRKKVEDEPRIANEAMELNRSLKDCLREESRKPSKMKNEFMIQQLKNKYWRIAMKDAVLLSEILQSRST